MYSWPFFVADVLLISLRKGEGPAPVAAVLLTPAVVPSLLGRLFLSVDGLRGSLPVAEVLVVSRAGVLGGCASPFRPPMAEVPSAVILNHCL